MDKQYTLPYTNHTFTKLSRFSVSGKFSDNVIKMQHCLKKAAVALEFGSHEGTNADFKKECQRGVKQADKEFKQVMDAKEQVKLIEHAVRVAVAREAHADYDLTPSNIEEKKVVSPLSRFQNGLRPAVNEYKIKKQAGKFANQVSAYREFRQAIFEISHDADEELPNIDRFYDDYNDSDEELVIEQEKISYKCPLTKQYFEHPVTSSKCGHSFEKSAIILVLNRGQHKKCPVSACNHDIIIKDLKPDPQLAARAIAQKNREIKESQLQSRTLERL